MKINIQSKFYKFIILTLVVSAIPFAGLIKYAQGTATDDVLNTSALWLKADAITGLSNGASVPSWKQLPTFLLLSRLISTVL